MSLFTPYYGTLHRSETWHIRKENEVALPWAEMRMVRWSVCGVKLQYRVPSKRLRERETRIRWHNLGTTAKQVAMVWACAAKKKTMIGWRNVWSMNWKVPGQEVDQRKLGEILWKKTHQALKLNREDAVDCNRWRKQIIRAVRKSR